MPKMVGLLGALFLKPVMAALLGKSKIPEQLATFLPFSSLIQIMAGLQV